MPFAIGFWSFSFPAAAFAAIVIEAGHRGGWPSWIGVLALVAATTLIAWLTVRTASLLFRGRLIPK
jgi:tellurite resistance protein